MSSNKYLKYSAKEFASLLGISRNSLYNYEKEGKLPPAKRIKNGAAKRRYYSYEDLHKARQFLKKHPMIYKSPLVQLIMNFKGGTGKSTIASNYAFRLAEYGYRVLTIDLDPQGHLTTCLGLNPSDFDRTMYNVLIDDMPIRDVVQETVFPNLHIVPANLNLSPSELLLTSMPAREFRLSRAIKKLGDEYDTIIIDTAPNQGILNLNGVLTADYLLIPVMSDYLSFDGLSILFRMIDNFKDVFEIKFDKVKIILNNYNESKNICKQVKDAIKINYQGYLAETIIRTSVALSNAQSEGKTIFQYNKNSKVVDDFDGLIKELMRGL